MTRQNRSIVRTAMEMARRAGFEVSVKGEDASPVAGLSSVQRREIAPAAIRRLEKQGQKHKGLRFLVEIAGQFAEVYMLFVSDGSPNGFGNRTFSSADSFQ